MSKSMPPPPLISIDVEEENDDEATDSDTEMGDVNSQATVDNESKDKGKKTMDKRSEVWKHFNLLTGEDGKVRGKSNYCPKSYIYKVSNGTTNLKNHMMKCLNNPGNNKLKQSQLSLQPSLVSGFGESENLVPGTLTTWKFDQVAMRASIIRWIIKDEQPFRFVETEGFREMMAICCPQLKIPSRWTVSRDCSQLFLDEKKKLKNYLKEHGHRVSITTDTWTSIARDNYMVITGHFVDGNWALQKKVLNFVKIDSHRGNDIGMSIENCLNDWDIKRLFTITVDNASSNDVAVKYVRNVLVQWGASVSSCQYTHMRCMAHIINLVVQDGLKEVDVSVTRVRDAIRFVRFSPQRLSRFKECVAYKKIESKSLLCMDLPTRWNSTYLMLSTAEKFEMAFDRYAVVDEVFSHELSIREGVPMAKDWDVVRKIAIMLKTFYTVTVKISGSKYVTSNTFWTEISNLYMALDWWNNGDDEQLRAMSVKMKQKFDKYWGDPSKMNKIIWFAAVFDPREKFEVVQISLKEIYGNEQGLQIFNNVHSSFFELFQEYQKEHDVREKTCDVPIEPQIVEVEAVASKYEPPKYVFHGMHKKQKVSSGEVGGGKRTELDAYLDEVLVEDTKGFDVLNWWRVHSARFPTLSIVARDILAVPVSTVASESTFSTGGRVLDDYRSSLSPDVAEALICTQDWIRKTPNPLFKEEDIHDADRMQKELEKLTIGNGNPTVNLCEDESPSASSNCYDLSSNMESLIRERL